MLLFRFVKHSEIKLKAKSNPVVDYQNSKLALLKEKTLPYTF
jgi:hypothetical protein